MAQMNWKGRNVLVTGAEGFIGSNIATTLCDKGARVSTIVRDLKKETPLNRIDKKSQVNRIRGDLVRFEDCERTINEYDIDFCFHVAAQALVGPASRSPLSTFESNIKGTWNVLEACRLHPQVKGIVVASSDKAYGQQKKLPYTEDSPLDGYYPYDASKACTEILARCYYKTYKLPLAITRCANIYGPGDLNESRIIPDAIMTLLRKVELTIRSDGTPERDYMYVKDAVSAYLTLAENLGKEGVCGSAFNFGTGKPISVIELFKRIAKAMGVEKSASPPKILGSAKHEIDRQYLDSSRAKKVLGWEPRYTLDSGLKESIEWYRAELLAK
jgi:CDP-glucose 4,6-dehydratase